MHEEDFSCKRSYKEYLELPVSLVIISSALPHWN